MKKNLIVLLLLVSWQLVAADYIDINLFVDPKFELEELNLVNFQLKNLANNDSITQKTFLSGEIFRQPLSDSLFIASLNRLNPDFVLPTDFTFSGKDQEFNILATNLKSDSLEIITNTIIRSDSISVGIFSVYSPDFAVKNKLAAELDFATFHLIEQYSAALAEEVDLVILLSGLGKYIDRQAVKDLPIDFVLSFDYMKKKPELMNSKTNFYSLISSEGSFGKLRLIYENGKISHQWLNEQLKPLAE
ncbi:MAG: hypothetical protein R6U84_07245 [Candidatus Cloacimonadales bacterium]